MSENSAASEAPTVFENIISGVWPGRFVWADEVCVAFATIEPQVPGHVLVVPRERIESFIDASDAVISHMTVVAKRIAATQVRVFEAVRPGIEVVGLDVPHLHIHVLPISKAADMNPAGARAASAEELDEAMTRLREGLIEDGWGANVPAQMSSPELA